MEIDVVVARYHKVFIFATGSKRNGQAALIYGFRSLAWLLERKSYEQFF